MTNQSAQEIAEHYQPQMDAYRRAMMVLLNLPGEKIAGKLLLLHSDQVVDV